MPDPQDITPQQVWTARSGWGDIASPGHIGLAARTGLEADLCDPVGMIWLAASEGGSETLVDAVHRSSGLGLPARPAVVGDDGLRIVWAGPGQWLVLADEASRLPRFCTDLGGTAAIADQSDSRVLLRLSGPDLRRTLAKGCMLDLHPSAFPVGAAALTSIAYMGVHLWRRDDGPQGARFEMTVARSMAASFWSWFAASAAEFGCAVTSSGRG